MWLHVAVFVFATAATFCVHRVGRMPEAHSIAVNDLPRGTHFVQVVVTDRTLWGDEAEPSPVNERAKRLVTNFGQHFGANDSLEINQRIRLNRDVRGLGLKGDLIQSVSVVVDGNVT